MADAVKINENFEALKSEILGSGGCSAEQDGSSVVITCSDGTAGVLASGGTVVYPLTGDEGEIISLSSLNTGDVIVEDGNGVYLAPFEERIYQTPQGSSGEYLYPIETSVGRMILVENSGSERVFLSADQGKWHFQEPDCEGVSWRDTYSNHAGLVINRFALEVDEYFRVGEVVASGVLSQSFLAGAARNRTTGELLEYQCSNQLSLQDVREIQKSFRPQSYLRLRIHYRYDSYLSPTC